MVDGDPLFGPYIRSSGYRSCSGGGAGGGTDGGTDGETDGDTDGETECCGCETECCGCGTVITPFDFKNWYNSPKRD